VRGVVDNFQVVLSGDGADGFYITGVAEYMNGYNGPCVWGNGRFNVRRVQAPGVRVYVCKYRLHAIPLQGTGSSDEGKGGSDGFRLRAGGCSAHAQGSVGNLQG